METKKFENDDEVFIRIPFKVTDYDSGDKTFLVENGDYDMSSWLPAEALFWVGDDSDLPLIPTDLVRPKFASALDRFGQIVSLSKGYAWVDWSPGTDDTAFGAHQVNALVRLTAEEVNELERGGHNVRALLAA